jgi:hypothetical protein
MLVKAALASIDGMLSLMQCGKANDVVVAQRRM